MLVFIQKVFWKVCQIGKRNLVLYYTFYSFYLIVKLIILNNMHKNQMFVCIENFIFSLYLIELFLDYLIERECLVNKFISVPKDKGIEMICQEK